MDPNEAHAVIVASLSEFWLAQDGLAGPGAPTALEAAEQLAEAVGDLNDWLCQGGFLPTAWTNSYKENA